MHFRIAAVMFRGRASGGRGRGGRGRGRGGKRDRDGGSGAGADGSEVGVPKKSRVEVESMQNAAMEAYYKVRVASWGAAGGVELERAQAQRIVPEGEWDEFWATMRKPLPTTFRCARGERVSQDVWSRRPVRRGGRRFNPGNPLSQRLVERMRDGFSWGGGGVGGGGSGDGGAG